MRPVRGGGHCHWDWGIVGGSTVSERTRGVLRGVFSVLAAAAFGNGGGDMD